MSGRPKSSSAAKALWAWQRSVRSSLGVLATPRESPQVVELEAVSFCAAPSQPVCVSAARFVPLGDGAANGGGDVSTAPAR
jgi:hypothetical protein